MEVGYFFYWLAVRRLLRERDYPHTHSHTHKNRRASGKRNTTSSGEMSLGACRGERDVFGMNEIMQI